MLLGLLLFLAAGLVPVTAARADGARAHSRVQWWCPALESYFDEYVFLFPPGTHYEDQLTLVVNNKIKDAEIEVSDEIEDLVSLEPAELGDLAKGQTVDLTITVDIPEDARVGKVYEGKVAVERDRGHKVRLTRRR